MSIDAHRATHSRSAVQLHRRDAGITDALRPYKVVIDQESAGHLAPGQSMTVELDPGEHEIYVSVDWARSKKAQFSLESGETARFDCAPRANLFTDLYWATVGRRRYIELVRMSD